MVVLVVTRVLAAPAVRVARQVPVVGRRGRVSLVAVAPVVWAVVRVPVVAVAPGIPVTRLFCRVRPGAVARRAVMVASVVRVVPAVRVAQLGEPVPQRASMRGAVMAVWVVTQVRVAVAAPARLRPPVAGAEMAAPAVGAGMLEPAVRRRSVLLQKVETAETAVMPVRPATAGMAVLATS